MRDWGRDWELCQKATPGPWYAWKSPSGIQLVNAGLYPEPTICRCYKTKGRVNDEANADFIAEAREALPYWLQQFRKIVEVLKDAEIYIHGKGPVTIDEILEEEFNTFEGREER